MDGLLVVPRAVRVRERTLYEILVPNAIIHPPHKMHSIEFINSLLNPSRIPYLHEPTEYGRQSGGS